MSEVDTERVYAMTWLDWEVFCKFGFIVKEKWFEYQPETVVENDSHKIWDASVKMNHVIEGWSPNLIVIDMEGSKYQIIDFCWCSKETEKDWKILGSS